MLLSPVATDIRCCNLTLYNGQVGLGLNKILQHKEMMFRAPRGLGSSESSMRQTLAPGASESWSPTLKAQKRRTSFEEGKTSQSSQRFCPLQRRSFFFELLECGTSFLRLQELRFASYSSHRL